MPRQPTSEHRHHADQDEHHGSVVSTTSANRTSSTGDRSGAEPPAGRLDLPRRRRGRPDRLGTGQVGEQRRRASRGSCRPHRVAALVELVLGQPAHGVVLAERGDRGLPVGVTDAQLGSTSSSESTRS